MIIEKRLELLLQTVIEKGSLSYDEAMQMTSCSRDTVRRDFIKLNEKNLVKKTRGGIIYNTSSVLSYDRGIVDKALSGDEIKPAPENIKNYDCKLAIAHKAVELINDNETVMFDSGSTTLLAVRSLPERENLTLITNCLRIVNSLAKRQDIHTIMLGGDVTLETLNIVGPDTIDMLRKYHVDKLFIGVAAVSVKNGLMSPYNLEAMLKSEMIKRADRVIVLADSTKINRNALYAFASLKDIDTLITDNRIDAQLLAELRSHDIEVLIS
jgi:DeoR/GlpR family transcriptional regulator of sugar metabolism